MTAGVSLLWRVTIMFELVQSLLTGASHKPLHIFSYHRIVCSDMRKALAGRDRSDTGRNCIVYMYCMLNLMKSFELYDLYETGAAETHL
jgi:hypothetical protein